MKYAKKNIDRYIHKKSDKKKYQITTSTKPTSYPKNQVLIKISYNKIS